MKRALALTTIAAGAALWFAAGCSIIAAPKPDPTRFYVLTPISDPATSGIAETTSGATGNLSIGLGPIHIPGYLDRSQMVTRSSANRIELSETDRWAEPLGASFGQAMAQDLSALLGTREIHFFPWYRSDHIDRQIKLSLYRFEATESGNAELSAHWEIFDGADGKLLYSSDTNLAEPMKKDEPGSEAAALSRALETMTRQIATAIQSVTPPASTAPSAVSGIRG